MGPQAKDCGSDWRVTRKRVAQAGRMISSLE